MTGLVPSASTEWHRLLVNLCERSDSEDIRSKIDGYAIGHLEMISDTHVTRLLHY